MNVPKPKTSSSRSKLLEQAGRPGRTRTHNERFWRPPLYHWSYWPVGCWRLAGLLVQGVLAAPRAVLLELHALRIVLLVLVRGVIAALALSAGEGNHGTHCFPPDGSWPRLSQPWRERECYQCVIGFVNTKRLKRKKDLSSRHNLHKKRPGTKRHRAQ